MDQALTGETSGAVVAPPLATPQEQSAERAQTTRGGAGRGDVVAVFQHICAWQGRNFGGRERAAVLSALERVEEHEPELMQSDAGALRVIMQIAAELDMRVEQYMHAPNDLHGLLEHDKLVLTCMVGGGTRWYLLEPGMGADAQLVQLGRRRRVWTVERDEQLIAALGDERDVPRPWLTLAPALPLEAMRLPPNFQGGKDDKTIYQLMALLHAERGAISTVLVYALVIGLFTLTTPLAVQAVVNTITFGTVLQPLVVLTLVLAVGLGCAGVLRVFQSYAVEFVQRRMFIVTVTDLANRLPRVHIRAHEQRYTPELVNRFFDITTVQKAASSLLLDGMDLSLQMAIGLLVLAFYHPLLLAFDIVLILALAGVIFLLGRNAIKTSLEESNAKYAVASWLEELARNPAAFKSREGSELATTRANTLALKYLEHRHKHYSIVLRQLIGVIMIQAMFSATLLGLGGWLVLRGQLTIGQLVAAELIVTSIVASMVKFGKHFETFYDLSASIYKIGELVHLPLEARAGEAPKQRKEPATLSLEGVSCGYPGSAPLLRDVNMEIEAGARVALMGASGSGKTLLLQTIHGMRAPKSGDVRFDDASVSDLSLPALRSEVAFVGEPELIEGSIEENILLGRQYLSRDAMRDIIKRVGLHETVSRMPDGLDTQLTTSGAPLSSGERARLMFARALAQRPRLVLIDGLLDHFNRTERGELVSALMELEPTLVIASRCDDIATRCGKTFQIEDGRIEEVG